MSVEDARASARLPPTGPDKPGRKWIGVTVLAVWVVVFAVLAAYDVSAKGGLLGAKPLPSSSSLTASPARSVPSTALGAPSAAAEGSPGPSSTVSASASPSGSPSATVAAPQELSVLSVAAFGPKGTSDGDNPYYVSRVLPGGGASPWLSSWYMTAQFGNLKAGTGLLLDMGRFVSVSSVRMRLGASVGADVELRLGDTAGGPADLATAASAYDVGGTVDLAPSSAVRARYVLIWFTKLPPDSAGTYQIGVYSVTVDGQK